MTEFQTVYEQWLNKVDVSDREQLIELGANEEEREDSFRCELAFGTGGLRGILGLGCNRMNVYTIGKATQGLANYLRAHEESPSVAIARDSRNGGEAFARKAACILAANGIRAVLYPRIEPTPALSFAVRDLSCSAGICITASHNPAEYNGYKVYGADGCQITTAAAAEIQGAITEVDAFDDVKCMDFDEGVAVGLIGWIQDDTLNRFLEGCLASSQGVEGNLKLVYTPLHGAGLECVSGILERIGVCDVVVEPAQVVPDGNFPTCPYPNPEIRAALERGLALAAEIHSDLLLATDPDADRVGIAVMHDGALALLTGNEVGILLTDYLCSLMRERGENLSNKVVVTTIVSSAMADALCEHWGFELRRTLTGFKYIGEQIGILEAAGEVDRFIFGFEESYGYLAGSHVRDKDAVVTSMLICEMACWYKMRGMDLIDAMDALYWKYGYYKNDLLSVTYSGGEGAKRMASIMEALRTSHPGEIAGLDVESVVDYAEGAPMPILGGAGCANEQYLPPANVLEFGLAGGNKVMIRPSGTEPKIKGYIFSKGKTAEQADFLLSSLTAAVREMLGDVCDR